MATKTQTWLTHEQIDSVVESLSAADLIGASVDGLSASQQAGKAFDAAAARQGVSNGRPATESVRAADFIYLAEKMSEVMGANSPKSDAGKDSPDSASTGE